MRGDGFGFAGALQHEELGQDGDGFEPNAEGPEDLANCQYQIIFTSWIGPKERAYLSDFVTVWKDDCQHGTASQ